MFSFGVAHPGLNFHCSERVNKFPTDWIKIQLRLDSTLYSGHRSTEYYIFIWWSRNLPGRGWDRLRQWTIFWPLDPWWGRQCPQEQPPPRLCCTIYWKSPAFFADAQSKPTCCLSTQLKLICLKQYPKSNNKSAILESLPGTYIIYRARCLKITANVSFIMASEARTITYWVVH